MKTKLINEMRALRKQVQNVSPSYSRKHAEEIRSFFIDFHYILFNKHDIDDVQLDNFIFYISVYLSESEWASQKYLCSTAIEGMFDYCEDTYKHKSFMNEPPPLGWREIDDEDNAGPSVVLLGGKLVLDGFSEEMEEVLAHKLKDSL